MVFFVGRWLCEAKVGQLGLRYAVMKMHYTAAGLSRVGPHYLEGYNEESLERKHFSMMRALSGSRRLLRVHLGRGGGWRAVQGNAPLGKHIHNVFFGVTVGDGHLLQDLPA